MLQFLEDAFLLSSDWDLTEDQLGVDMDKIVYCLPEFDENVVR